MGDRRHPDGTGFINESHHALNSPDNKIEKSHENTNDEWLSVSFNELGQWNGPAQFATWIREITRSRIPLRYENWRKVPPHYKEDVRNYVQVSLVGFFYPKLMFICSSMFSWLYITLPGAEIKCSHCIMSVLES